MAKAEQAAQAGIAAEVRARLLADPGMILDDPDLMRALAETDEGRGPANVVDLRGMAMARVEDRLGALERTHKAVIAAAYENLAATAQVHRAVLRLMDETRFEGFLDALGREVSDILRLDSVQLLLESDEPEEAQALDRLAGVLAVRPRGAVEAAMNAGRGGPLRRPILLRELPAGGAAAVHGARADRLRSEALLRLDLGPGRLPALLALGSDDAAQFRPGQATDLLGFFAGVIERILRRYLA